MHTFKNGVNMHCRCRRVCDQELWDTGRSQGEDHSLGQGESGSLRRGYFLKPKCSFSMAFRSAWWVLFEVNLLLLSQPTVEVLTVGRLHACHDQYPWMTYAFSHMLYYITRSLIIHKLSEYGSHFKYEFVLWWHPRLRGSYTLLHRLQQLMSLWWIVCHIVLLFAAVLIVFCCETAFSWFEYCTLHEQSIIWLMFLTYDKLKNYF